MSDNLLPPQDQLSNRFSTLFLPPPTVMAHAGGRANLIGEHTDYHEGFVLPCAIDLRTICLAAPDASPKVTVYSETTRQFIETTLDDLENERTTLGRTYLLAPIWAAARHHPPVTGVRILIHSSLPLGAGLSSSAALMVSMAAAVTRLWGTSLSPRQIAEIALEAERSFCGAPCGAMDQLASTLGKPGHFLLIDCRTLQVDPIPFPDEWAVVVADTGIRHSVAASEYRRRRAETDHALKKLRERYPHLRALRDVTPEMLPTARTLLDRTEYRRLRHVVHENQRVLEAAKALRSKDAQKLGALLAESHESLAIDYEVSTRELDLLVDIATTIRGCIGSRMCGAGFGGSTINVVDASLANYFAVELRDRYVAHTGDHATIRQVHPAQGLVLEDLTSPPVPRA